MSEALSLDNACGASAVFQKALGFQPEYFEEYTLSLVGTTIDHSEILRSYLHNVRINLACSDHPQATNAAYLADALLQRYQQLTDLEENTMAV